MSSLNKILLIALLLLSGVARGEPDAADKSADLTAKNIALVSSALTTHQKGINAIAATRSAHIVSVVGLAAKASRESDREIAILKQTDGTSIVKVYEALCEVGDQAALASAQAVSAEAATKADIAAAYTPLAISTDKLDRAAKTLATLATQQSDTDRAKFLLQFLKDTRDESEKLAKASKDAKDDADKKLNNAVTAGTKAVDASVAKASAPK